MSYYATHPVHPMLNHFIQMNNVKCIHEEESANSVRAAKPFSVKDMWPVTVLSGQA